jgi:hypothetical protein
MLGDWAERNLKLIPVIVFVAIATVSAGFLLAAKAVQEPPPREADRISYAGTLLVVMQAGCGACTYFEDNVAPEYQRTEQAGLAPLRYIDATEVGSQTAYRLKTGIFGTPTLLMIDGFGREVGRSVGSPSNGEALAKLVDRYAARMTRKGV